MAYASFGPFFALPTAADLRAHLYHAVKVTNAGTVAVCGLGELAVGILTDDRDLEEHASFQYRDVAKWVAGEALEPGDVVMSGADGRAVELATDGHAMGIVLLGGDEDAVISVLLRGGYIGPE